MPTMVGVSNLFWKDNESNQLVFTEGLGAGIFQLLFFLVVELRVTGYNGM